MTRIFYYAWEKPACCVSKISSDCGCQSKETGVGMEVRLLSVGARGFFSSLRDSPSRLRRSILSLPTRKNTSGTQGKVNGINHTQWHRLFQGKASTIINGIDCYQKRHRPLKMASLVYERENCNGDVHSIKETLKKLSTYMSKNTSFSGIREESIL